MSRSAERSDDSYERQRDSLYFRDEADEGNETDENASVATDDVDGATSLQFTKKGKKTLKICRHFSYALISNASCAGWEDAEIASLIILVAGQLNLDEAKLIRCLEKTGTGSPNVVAQLVDNGIFSFTVPQLVSILLGYAKNVEHFIHVMGEACECDMFDLTNTETIDVVSRNLRLQLPFA
jgi:hypothetical protein